jgi:hypothetical protein
LSVFHELCTIRSPSASLLIRLPLKNILVVRLLWTLYCWFFFRELCHIWFVFYEPVVFAVF